MRWIVLTALVCSVTIAVGAADNDRAASTGQQGNGKKDGGNGKADNKKNDDKKGNEKKGNDKNGKGDKKNEKKDDQRDEKAELAKEPPRSDFFILPLNVHVLTADGRPDITCQLSDADYRRIVNQANQIWRQAGIQFYASTILREEAEHLAAFDKKEKEAGADDSEEKARQHYRLLAPDDTAKLPGFHVYYVHKIQPRGTYLGDHICFIKETAELRKVDGGADEPLARVTAHELGHALGLRHRKDERTNLMGASTNGTHLNQDEADRARATAKKAEGRLTVAEAKKKQRELEDEGKRREAEVLGKLLDTLDSK